MPDAILAAALESLEHQRAQGTIAKGKNATPDPAPTSVGEVFDQVRPSAILAERSSHNIADGNDQRANALSSYALLQVQTGSRFIQQWNAQYAALAFPFVLPYAVGGPEFP